MWQTLLQNQLYLHDDFLPQEMVDQILNNTSSKNFKSVNNRNTPPVMFDTNFDYDLLIDPAFRDLPIRDYIFDTMDPVE